MEQSKMDGLPEGWRYVKLKDACNFEWRNIQPQESQIYNYIGLEHIESDTGRLVNFVPQDGKDILSTKVTFSEGAVLYGKLRPYLRKAYVAQFDGIATTEILPINAKPGLDSKFLLHFILSDAFTNLANSSCQWARMPRASPKFIKESIRIPLPPLSEQERIVAKLDGIFEHIDASVKLLEQNIADSDAMAESVLDEAFFFTKSWDDGQLVRLWDIGNYQNGKAFKPNEWGSSWLPIIRIQNLNWINSNYNYCNFEVADKFIIHDGDLLFAWSWTPWTSFGAHIWNGWKAVLNQHIFRIDFDRNSINTRYFQLALNQTVLHFINQSHGSSWLAHIKKGEFEKSKIPLPPLPEQERIVAKLDAFFAEQKAIKSGYETKISELKALKSSILSSAFRGEV